jgi:hypothetical protein
MELLCDIWLCSHSELPLYTEYAAQKPLGIAPRGLPVHSAVRLRCLDLPAECPCNRSAGVVIADAEVLPGTG